MIERIRPVPEAAERIRQFGEKKIWQFLGEVTLGSSRNLVEFMPVVHGFRPQSEAGIKQQKLTLAKRLASKSSGTERDFIALYMMWRAWAWEQLGDPDAVDRLLDDLQNVLTQQRPQGDDSDEALRAGTLTFLNALKQLSIENKCSREKIVRLIDFSPLAWDNAGQNIIDACKSESEIERDKAITDLPDRLRADEKEIQSNKDWLGALSADIKAAIAKADVAEQTAENHGRTLRKLSDTADRLVKALGVIEESATRNAEALGRLEKRSDEVAGQVRLSGRRQDELDGELKATAKSFDEALGRLRSIVEPIQSKFAGVSPVSMEAVESIAKEVQTLGARLYASSQGPTSEEVETLKTRLDALESTKPIEPPTTSTAEPVGVGLAALVEVPNTTVEPLADAGAIIRAVAASLQSIGLKRSAAVLFSEEVTAAILTGQIVTFKGALAHLVARTCAQTLSSGCAWNISIPIGLTDGRSLDAALRFLSSKSTSTVPSLVVEGLNRSALDCTKETLLAYATDRSANNRSPIFCFASLVSGIAALPVESGYFELGPVFDLDYLDWRLSPDAAAASAYGSVTSESVKLLGSKLMQGTADGIDEALRVLRKFMPKRNPRIERAVAAGYAALQNNRQKRNDASPMQSLAFGWFVPLWITLGLSKEDADSELDGGKCDASNADPRVAAMLTQEPFSVEQAEGDE